VGDSGPPQKGAASIEGTTASKNASGEGAPQEAVRDEGYRYVLLCRGADGIGKTRIFRYLRERARMREVSVYEIYHYDAEGVPLKPFLHTIRRILTDLDDPNQSRAGTALLDRYRYSLERLIPEAFGRDEVPTAAELPRLERLDAEKVRIFDGITQLLLEVATRKPLSILVHDLHLADRATVELLRYIGRNVQLRNEGLQRSGSVARVARGNRDAAAILGGPEIEGFGEDWRGLSAADRAGASDPEGLRWSADGLPAPASPADGPDVLRGAESGRPQVSRLAILANYRAEPDSESYLEKRVEALGAEPFSFHVELRPLSRKEAGRFLELSVEGVEVGGRPLEVADDAADALWRVSEGFPSFQQELLRGVYLLDGDLAVWSAATFESYLDGVASDSGPARLKILRRRIGQYDPAVDEQGTAGSQRVEVDVLRVLALARRPVDADLVSRVLGDEFSCDEIAVRDALAVLIDDGVVEKTENGLCHFRLWDYGHVVEAGIDAVTRSRLHQRIGEERRVLLESGRGSGGPAYEGAYEIYFHLSRGENPVSALGFGETAGALFERSLAFEKAKELYRELVDMLAGDEHLESRRRALMGLIRVTATLHEFDAVSELFALLHEKAATPLEPLARLDLLILEADIAGVTDPGRGLKVLAKAAKLLPDETSPEAVRLYQSITRLRLKRQDWKRAMNYGLKGVSIAQKLEDDTALARFFQLIARAFYRRGDYTHAVDNYQRALEPVEKLDEASLTVDILDELGRVYLERGNYFRAARYLYKALEMRQREKDVAGLCRSYDQLALVYRRDGDYHKTIENLHRSLELKERIGDFVGLNPTLGMLGDLYMRLGSYELAIECFQREVDNSRRLEAGDVEETGGLSDAFVRLGRVYYEIGDLKQSESYCKQVLILAPEYKLRSEEADGMLLQGNLLALRRDWNAAEKTLKQAGEAYAKLGHRMRETCALLDLAEIKFERELFDEALKIASKAQIIADDIKALDLRVRALTIKGNVHRFLKGGNPEKVKELFGKALELSQHLNDVTALFQLLYSLGKVFHNNREFSEASNCYGKAEAILERVGVRLGEDLNVRYLEDSRRKIFLEDVARFRKESHGRASMPEPSERVLAPVDLRERPVSLEDHKDLLDRVLRVNGAVHLIGFVENVLAEGLELAKGERGFVMLVENREYAVATQTGFGKDIEQHSEFSAASQIAEDTIRRGKTFLPRSSEERRKYKQPSFDVFNSRSVMVVPLMTDDRIFGALFVDKHLSLGRFGSRDQSLLESFARHAGVALQNRRHLDVAIREPLTGFFNPSYFIERLREEYRLFNLHGGAYALGGFYLPVFEDSVGDAHGELAETIAREIQSACRGVAVCWGNPILFLLLRDTELSVAEELMAPVKDRLESLLNEEVPFHVLAADRRHQQGSDIYYEIRRRLLPEECDHKTLTELRRLLAREIKLKDAKRILEKHIIETTMRKTGGNITHAARELGIHRPQLSNYLKKYGLKRELYEPGLESSRINPVEN